MATLIRDEARRLLQDGFTLRDAPRDHARWKIGNDTVREVTVQHWLNHSDIKATSPGVYVWIGKQPAFVPMPERNRDGSSGTPEKYFVNQSLPT